MNKGLRYADLQLCCQTRALVRSEGKPNSFGWLSDTRSKSCSSCLMPTTARVVGIGLYTVINANQAGQRTINKTKES